MPGYLTLGTTWSTAVGTNTSTHDGGTWGGLSFNLRPDAFSFFYKREYGSNSPSENASFIGYIWKGDYSQSDVPVTIVASGSPNKTTMTNRERNILGMETPTGGAVTSTSDAALIAKAIVTEAGAVSSWTKKIIEFEYLNDYTPSYINLIFSANDYFSTASATKGNSLSIDDVILIYYSRLSDIKLNGQSVSGFSPDRFSYTLDQYMPDNVSAALSTTLLGGGKSASVNIVPDAANDRVSIKVTGVDADVDGNSEHTYTLQFKPRPKPDITSLTVAGTPVSLSGSTISTGLPYSADIAAACSEGGTAQVSTMTIVNGLPTVTVTAYHADAIVKPVYTLTFLPYEARLAELTVGGTAMPVDIDNIETGKPYSSDIQIDATPFTGCSGTPAVTQGNLSWNGNVPTITLTVTNAPAESHSYTLSFLPAKSAVTSVTVGGKTVSVPAGETVIDFTMLPMPASGDDITVKTVATGMSGTAALSAKTADTASASFTLTVTNSLNTSLSTTYTLSFMPYAVKPTAVTIGGKSVSVEGLESDSWTISEPLPESTDLIKISFAASSGTPVAVFGPLTPGTPSVTATLRNTNVADRTVTINFLPYIAEIESVTLANGHKVEFDGQTKTAMAGLRYSDGVKPAGFTASPTSGTVEVSFSDMTTPDDPKITATAKNTVTGTTETYTIIYEPPVSSRLAGVSIGGAEYLTGPDGITIDATARPLPMPAAADITPVFVHPSSTQKVSSATADTEAGTITLTVTNTAGADFDGQKSHTYTIRFRQPEVSRLAALAIGDLELTPAFNSKTYSYAVRGWMPETDEEIVCTPFAGHDPAVTIEREGDPYAEHPVIRIKVSGSGPDYDGQSEHTYTLSFNQRTHTYRSVKLSSISISGSPLEGFSPDIYSYHIGAPIPAEGAVGYELLEYQDHPTDGTTAEIVRDENAAKIVVSVSNSTYSDSNGRKIRDYTLQFLPYYSRLKSISANGETVQTSSVSDTEFTFHGQMPDADGIVCELVSPSAGNPAVTKTLDRHNATATVKVENERPDTDGLSVHTYTLYFDKPFFSRLAALSIGGVPVDGFSPDIFSYTLDSQLPADDEVTARFIEGSNGAPAIKSQTTDRDKATVTIVVANSQPDLDGLSEHTYTIRYALPYFSRLASLSYAGTEISPLVHDGSVTTIPGQLPATDEAARKLFSFTTMQGSGDPQVAFSFNHITSLVTITVTNGDNADTDGAKSHTYLLQFGLPFRAYLSDIRINEVTISGFKPEKFDYTLSGQMPALSTIEFIPTDATSGVAVVETPVVDAENSVITVTVSNDGGGNEAYASSNTYTLRFDKPYFSRLESLSVSGVAVSLVHDGTPMPVDMVMPEDAAAYAAVAKAGSGNPVVTGPVFDTDAHTATFKVTNSGGYDPLGGTSRIYILQFKAPYFSTASSITVGGREVEGFNPEVLEYTLPGQMPDKEEIALTVRPGSGHTTWSATADPESATITVTVTNDGDGDSSNASVTTYILRFDKPFFSRLASLRVNGVPVEGFNRDTFSYTLSGTVPEISAVEAVAMEGSGKATVTLNRSAEEGQLTVTVKNAAGADLDGKDTHIYTLRYDKPVSSRLASISIDGTPLSDFDPATYSYNLTTMPLPAREKITFTLLSEAASAEMTVDEENAVVTITVTAAKPDADGLSSHTYTLRFKKPETPAPEEGKKTVYSGMLTIIMGGEDMTGGGQEATVEIVAQEDGSCAFRLPDFRLALAPGTPPAELGDIVVENVSVVKNADGSESYTGNVQDMALLGGEIIADVNLTGTVDPEGNARMTIEVVWKPGGGEDILINVEFNGKRDDSRPDPPGPAEEWTDYDGALSIEMGGSYIAENQPATVFITDTDPDGCCIFKLPDFSLDMEGTTLSLGDIVVEDVKVTAEADGTLTYTGFTPAMSFLGGEIVADIDLKGTVAPSGEARMAITVLWLQGDGSSIPINVVFNGRRNSIAWLQHPGTLTVNLQGYDLTEGGKATTLKTAQTGEDGSWSFMIPDLIIALDASSDPVKLGDIRVDGLTRTTAEGTDHYAGGVSGMKLASGAITADVKIDGYFSAGGHVLVNVDVVWLMDDGQRVPIMVRFTNGEERPATPVRTGYSGILITSSGNEAPVTHNVTVLVSPVYDNRADLVISGIDFPLASRAAELGSTIKIADVTLTDLLDGRTAFDGAATSHRFAEGVTLDITLHGISDTNRRLTLALDLHWLEAGIRLSGSFSGDVDAGVTGIGDLRDDSNGDESSAEYFNLRGVRVNRANLTPGIYIRRAGGKSTKILIK